MTVMIEDLSGLEDLLDKTPPCQGLVWGQRCLQPSVARVTVTCCGTTTIFVCEVCLGALKTTEACCNACWRPISRWSPA